MDNTVNTEKKHKNIIESDIENIEDKIKKIEGETDKLCAKKHINRDFVYMAVGLLISALIVFISYLLLPIFFYKIVAATAISISFGMLVVNIISKQRDLYIMLGTFIGSVSVYLISVLR